MNPRLSFFCSFQTKQESDSKMYENLKNDQNKANSLCFFFYLSLLLFIKA